MMQMHADVKQFLKDPGNLETCLQMIREHRERAGIPPTLELLGNMIWRKIVRGVASSRAARATGSGAAPKPGRKRKRPAAAKTAAVAAEEAQKSEAEKGGQEKPRKVRKRKKGAEEEKEERAEEGAEKGEGGEKEGAEEGEEEEAEKGEEMERLDNAQEAEEGEEEAAHEETESRDAEEVEEKEAEEVEEEKVEPEKVETEEVEPEKAEKKQPSRTQTQRKRKTKQPRRSRTPNEEAEEAGGPSTPTAPAGLTDSGGQMILKIAPHVDYPGDPLVWRRDPRLRAGQDAEQHNWRQCECNGTCGAKSCPGRRKAYKHCEDGKARVARVGCPNPALVSTQVKPRCASCVCKVITCEQLCDLTGFCRQHRIGMKQARKRPAADLGRPAAGMERPAAGMEAAKEQQVVALRRLRWQPFARGDGEDLA